MASPHRQRHWQALRQRWAGEPYWRLLGVDVEEVAQGYVRLRLPLQQRLCNRNGPVHGGAIASLVDIAAMAALDSALDFSEPDLLGHSTIEPGVSFLEAAQGAALAEARIIRLGGTIAVCDVDVRDEGGGLLAKGRATFMLFRRR
ncbi:MAG: PaaI family thioesterase [Dehalococcoidia bacterium]